MSTVLITGAAGFIGSHVTEALVRKGHRVIGLDNLSHGYLRNLSSLQGMPGFNLVQGDVRDYDLLTRIGNQVDVILHLAAYKIPRYGNAIDTLAVNVKGTENILRLAQFSNCKIIFASTSDVYGKNPHLPYSEDNDFYLGSPQVQRWSYAVSKILGEHLCFAYHKERGVRVTILRYFGSYGPRQNLTWWGGPQSIFIDCALKNKSMPIHGDGLQTRSFTYIEDTLQGTLKAVESEEAVGKVFNIGNTEEVTILSLGEKIWKLIRGSDPANVEFIPYRQFGRYEDVRRRVPDIRLSREVLGFSAGTSLSEGLPPTIEWQKRLTAMGEN
jgi:UDP-glucose 4-epimerase